MTSDLYVSQAEPDDDVAPALPRQCSAEAKRVHGRIIAERLTIAGADLSLLRQRAR